LRKAPLGEVSTHRRLAFGAGRCRFTDPAFAGSAAVAALWRALAVRLRKTIQLAAIRQLPDEVGFRLTITARKTSTPELNELRRGLLLSENFQRISNRDFNSKSIGYRLSAIAQQSYSKNLFIALLRPSLAKSALRPWKA
jgi:hypothetical protein